MTTPSVDAVRVPVADVHEAAAFYASAFGAPVTTEAVGRVDLHGKGTIELVASDASLADRFGRVVMTYVLEQPSEVRAVMDAAVARGARVLKPAKKALFGSFSGSFASPDGLIWKLASDKGKDTAPPAVEPRPTEVTIILGVREPKESRSFYAGLGMQVDRDYGSKYIDFVLTSGTARLCLMQSGVLAKDVGVADSSEASEIALVHGTDAFVDPDGFRWESARV